MLCTYSCEFWYNIAILWRIVQLEFRTEQNRNLYLDREVSVQIIYIPADVSSKKTKCVHLYTHVQTSRPTYTHIIRIDTCVSGRLHSFPRYGSIQCSTAWILLITDTLNTMFLNLNISLQDCGKENKLQPFFCNYKLISASKNLNKRKRKLKMSLLSSFCANTFNDFYTNTQHHVE